jgi:hypothetical protein
MALLSCWYSSNFCTYYSCVSVSENLILLGTLVCDIAVEKARDYILFCLLVRIIR